MWSMCNKSHTPTLKQLARPRIFKRLNLFSFYLFRGTIFVFVRSYGVLVITLVIVMT